VLFKPTKEMPNYEQAMSLIGGFTNFIFAVDDINRTHQELSARGVEFRIPRHSRSGAGGQQLRTLTATSLGCISSAARQTVVP